ncbi:hypothetical protein [Ereboglobus luteus]|uniref:Uncharacterized protein n=1 Tax=Ereboglobus luteus TaxID=1796921 RepID=A0A2U8E0U1_9BACT|nr:hypothetical protein [Ereboglobus luteus]AWI08431.1 hypothetical protein CKA38_03445 [Ereboglobus luteus]
MKIRETLVNAGFLDFYGSRHKLIWIFVLVLLVTNVYLISYFQHPEVPQHADANQGWIGWFDQGEYYKTARDIANGEIKPSNYWYGYPAIGALTYHFLPKHAFLLPNLVMVTMIMVFFFLICARYLTTWESLILTVLAFMVNQRLWVNSLIIPWNTIPVYLAVFACVWLLIFENKIKGRWLYAALAIALACFSRPPDTPMLCIIYYGSALCSWRNLDGKIRVLAYPVVFICVAVAMQLGAHIYLYKSLWSPYLGTIADVGFNWGSLPLKLYQMFVDPTLLCGATMLPPGKTMTGIVAQAPYVTIIIPGIIYAFQRTGLKILLLPLAIAFSITFYAGFNPISYTPYFWSYLLFHYFWWFLPWMFLFSWLTISRAWRSMRLIPFVACLLGILALISLFSYKVETLSVVPVLDARSAGDAHAATIATANDGKSTTIKVPLPQNERVYSLHFTGREVVPFHASVAGNHVYFKVSKDGVPLVSSYEYFPVGDPDSLYLSFINSPIRGKTATEIEVEISGVDLSRVGPASCEILTVRWRPFSNWSQWFARKPPRVHYAQNLQPPNRIGLFAGWSGGGPDYMWTLGKESEMAILCEAKDQKSQYLVMELSAFRPQMLGVYINDIHAGEISVNSTSKKPYAIKLPTPLELGYFPRIRLLVSNPTRPKDIGMNDDTRELGVALHTARFEASFSP